MTTPVVEIPDKRRHVSENGRRVVSRTRSVVKALSYRVVILTLDFLTVYLFTRTVRIALGFMVVSNIYTTLIYVLHERLWARVGWGIGGEG